MKTLYIAITNTVLREIYSTAIEKHNAKVDSLFPDAGFDLINPSRISSPDTQLTQITVDTEIVCSMRDEHDKSYSYYLYPRSSICKTKLRLANSVGIIDSGYRGNIIGVFDVIHNQTFSIDKHARLLQICSGDLQPFYIQIVDNIQSIGTTERGKNGFGSTGV